MADETKRLKPAQITEDESAFAALQVMAGYAPANPDYSVESVAAAHAELLAARAAEAQTAAAAEAARDNAVAKEWKFHKLILGVKDQVTAQFVRNSNQVQAVNLKKTSEYKAPKRKAGKGEGDK